MTAVQLGEDLPLTGTVRNLYDGRVELILEGEPADIDTLIERLSEHFGSFVRNVVQNTGGIVGDVGPGIHVVDEFL